MRRERRPPQSGEYVDPLSVYDGPDHADEFERSLCEDPVTVIGTHSFVKVSPTETLHDVLELMHEQNSACAVIIENDRPVGIFSERDVLNLVADQYPQTRDLPIAELMTRDPYVVYESDTPAQVLNLMGTGGFRHVPVVDADGRLINVIGVRSMTSYLRRHMVREPEE